jgi:hypothetical protein
MSRLKDLLRRSFPDSAVLYKRARSQFHRLRHGNGSVGVFDHIARDNRWQDSESLSGGGSNLRQTERIRHEIPGLLSRIGTESVLDAPCGDFHWMRLVDLGGIHYIGADIVAPLIVRCREKYGSEKRQFLVRNIVTDPLPRADIIFNRDCLVHLSYEHVFATLRNFCASGSKYLLTTTYTSRKVNWNIVTGNWRPVNLEISPFNFPSPLEVIVEASSEHDGDFADKSLALWRLESLRTSLNG